MKLKFAPLSATVVCLLVLNISANAQPRGSATQPSRGMGMASTSSSSPFSLGTLFGITMVEQPKYVVVDRVVQLAAPVEKLAIGAYALPSYVIVNIGSFPLSALIPIGLNVTTSGSTDAAIGLGLSLGFNDESDKVDIGIGAAAVWVGREVLSGAQQVSFDNQSKVPDNNSIDITTQRTVALTIGFYVAPHF